MKISRSRGSGRQTRLISVYVMFLGLTPRKSDWKYLMINVIVNDGWNVNGIQWIVYLDRSADSDYFEWSHVHTQLDTWKVIGILNRWNNHHVVRVIEIPAVFESRVCVTLSVLVLCRGD